jgi:hypothetical protein
VGDPEAGVEVLDLGRPFSLRCPVIVKCTPERSVGEFDEKWDGRVASAELGDGWEGVLNNDKKDVRLK